MKRLVLLLISQTFIFCQSEKNKLNFTEFSLIDEEGTTFLEVKENGDVFYHLFETKLIAKIDKKKGIINSSKNEKELLIDSETVTKPNGEYVFTMKELEERKYSFLVDENKKKRYSKADDKVYKLEWTKKGTLLINGQKKDLKMFPENNKSYKVASLFIIMLYPDIDY